MFSYWQNIVKLEKINNEDFINTIYFGVLRES